MFNVAIATSFMDRPCPEYTVSMIELILYFAQNPVYEGNMQQGIRYLTPEKSCVLSANRERHAEAFLATPCTHLCFIDADMGFQPDVLHILASRKVPYVAVNYSMKVRNKPDFTALSLDKKMRVWTGPESTGIEECDFTGFGIALIERQVIEKIPRPRFLIGYNMAMDHYTTEDAPFCHKAREAGFPIYVDHDATKQCWHMGSWAFRWDDVPKREGEVTNGE
jgi:hypothetical protein